jgi:hypothetical protein
MPTVKISKVTNLRHARLSAVTRVLEKATEAVDHAMASWNAAKARDFGKAGFRIGQVVRVPHPGPGPAMHTPILADVFKFLVVGQTFGGKTTRVPRIAVVSDRIRFLVDPDRIVILPKKERDEHQRRSILAKKERLIRQLKFQSVTVDFKKLEKRLLGQLAPAKRKRGKLNENKRKA